ncbi:MAG: helix-turn-helix transcriptional regulator [Bacilli bacterium]
MKIIANNFEVKEIMKIIREWTELSQEDFAKSIGRKSRDGISSIEQGRAKVYLNELLKIAKKHNLIITIEKK